MYSGRVVRHVVVWMVVGAVWWATGVRADDPQPNEPQDPPAAPGGGADTSYVLQTVEGGYAAAMTVISLRECAGDAALTRDQVIATLEKAEETLYSPLIVSVMARYYREPDLRARVLRARASDFINGVDFGMDQVHVTRDAASPLSGVGVFTKIQVMSEKERETLKAIVRLADLVHIRLEDMKARKQAMPNQPLRLTQEMNAEFEALFMQADDVLALVNDYISTLKRGKLSLTAAHRRLGSASETSMGAVASRLGRAHFAPTLAAERVDLNRKALPQISAWRVSSALTWQDRLPFTVTKKQKEVDVDGRKIRVEEISIPRWRWMIGVGYTFENDVDSRYSSIFFVRYRPQKTYGLEFSSFVGHSRRDTTLVGLSVQYAFYLGGEY